MTKCLSFAVALVAPFLYAEMEPATPESQGVESQGIIDFIDACEQTFDGVKEGRVHGFVIVRHGKVIAEGSWKPFDTLNETHMLYSHSKSFTSTAIGFLVDDGKLDLDERVADIFPEDLPEHPADGICEIRVRDLLTMNVGSDLNHDVTKSSNWRRRFFERKLDRKPGTGFKYDSDATYMLACIVERRTGRKLMDFLEERLFSKIGIKKAWTTTSPQGIACGGWGMNMTTRELARFGQLYLQKGYWNGENIISPYWVALATARHTWSGWQNVGAQRLGAGTEWEQGYGFQFWRCTHNAYRADGARGQYTVIVPDQDLVVSMHAGLCDIQKEINLIWNHLLPAMKDGVLPENEQKLAELRGRIAALAIPPVTGNGEKAIGNEGELYGDYAIEDNWRGIRAVRIMKDADGWKMKFYARCWPSEFPIGFNGWKKGALNFDPDSFEAIGTLQWTQETAASAAFDKDGALKCRVYMTGTTHYLDFKFFMKDGVPTVEGKLWGMGGTDFKGSKMKEPVVPADLSKTDDPVAVKSFFERNEFGSRPVEKPSDLTFKLLAQNECLGGKAIHQMVEISSKGTLAPFAFVAHAYFPKGAKNVPVMVSINLGQWLESQKFNASAEDPSISSWPIKDVIARGIATIGFRNSDIANDGGNCFETGVFKAFGPVTRADDSWGALSAWAWGASRCVDWLETLGGAVDMKRIGVIGHSRGGKTALWAGVTDSRFSLVCVNNSGCGGAKLNRMVLPWSETIDAISAVFPYWFAPNFRKFAKDNGASMPYDQHNLLSLVAPRKLVIGSATKDDWAGPKGEEAAAKLGGAKHFWREGGHDLTPSDWSRYLENL